MIRNKREKPEKPLEIDLTGPEGNAFSLMKQVEVLGRRLGYSRERIVAIRKVMMMGDYDGLVKVFDKEFGHIITLWR